ncbi:hypothetical protein QWY14_02635 [Planococcus sp. N028]|uniref:DUF3784 domain-containing protein n=1 Tax=Planococcus shixiaomingii TaxID=3058393 RepID=A0ABT8MZ91_9BACL|nr:hypothetical protein [Planococcus sp. N028]MDN7240665.1 hypothetical protein [Planococcus sp. N028]
MNGEMIVKIIIIILGAALLYGGVVYAKKNHEEFTEGTSSLTYSDSFIALIIVFLFGVFLSIGPWWLAKIVILLFGIALLYSGIFLL